MELVEVEPSPERETRGPNEAIWRGADDEASVVPARRALKSQSELRFHLGSEDDHAVRLESRTSAIGSGRIIPSASGTW